MRAIVRRTWSSTSRNQIRAVGSISGTSVGQPLADFLHRPDDPLEPAQLAAQAEDAPDRLLLGKRIDRGLFHVVGDGLKALHRGQIAIDDEIEDRMEHVVGALGQPLGVGFERAAQADMGALRPEAHRDDEIGPEEKGRLAISQRFIGFERGRARDDEQVLLVDVELGHLLRAERILDGERMQAILMRHPVHLVVVGLAQADPVEGAARARAAAGRIGCPGQFQRTRAAPPCGSAGSAR
jgi:hypothetical protein